MLFHILRHIEADHGGGVPEHDLGQGPAQLGFADSGGTQEQEGTDGTARILQAGPAPPDRPGHGLHRRVLSHDPLLQEFVQPSEPLALSVLQLLHGDPGPFGDDFRHVLRRHLGGTVLPHVPLFVPSGLQLAGHALFLVPEGGRPLVVLPEDGLLLLRRHGPELFLQLPDRGRRSETGEALLAGRLVDEVDGLVGQTPVPDIAHGQGNRRPHRFVRDPELVVRLVFVPQAEEDPLRLLRRGLSHRHRLEPPLESRVPLDVLPVFVGRGGSDHLQLPSGQSGR